LRILIFGVYPPRLGGISIHLERFHAFLKSTNQQVTIVDYWNNEGAPSIKDVIRLPNGLSAKLVLLLQLTCQTTPDTIVHFHVAAMDRFKYVALPLLLFFWRQPKAISIHAGKITAAMDNWANRFFLRTLSGGFRKIICVNEEQASFLHHCGISSDKLIVVPAFIPFEPISSLLPNVLRSLRDQKTLVLCSGYLVDYYNLDVLIDCIPALDLGRYHFVFGFYGDVEPVTRDRVLGKLKKYSNTLIFRDQPPDIFAAIVAACDIYVRTPFLDGDAITVREALYLGKLVFASDCVRRPEQVYLFSATDRDSLLRLFQQHEQGLLKVSNTQDIHAADRILEIYQDMIHSEPHG